MSVKWLNESLVLQHMSGPTKGKVARVRVVAAKPKKGESAPVTKVWESPEEIRIEVRPHFSRDAENDPALKAQPMARVRDAVGAVVGQLEKLEVDFAEIELDLPAAERAAAILGLELALYRYKRVRKGELARVRLSLVSKKKPLARAEILAAVSLARGVNLARHLVNLPPNELNPKTYAELVQSLFKGVASVKVEIWDAARLKREGMHLHLAVGQGAVHPPQLVVMRYLPRGGAAKGASPVALVGKGITFDSGGLDIKPSSGMRLMKKDMGGSAAVLGVIDWAAREGLKMPITAYLALAENAVDAHSFRPSDVLTSRQGLTVEIHNTDAEGRLVLADAMDVAITTKPKPRVLIDVATLTGAIKVTLGGGLGGLFANDSRLRDRLWRASSETGDWLWPVPLVQKYRSSMQSNFADMTNAVDGFGGAVTAALFLEKFAGDVPWAHLDIYAWKDSADGAWLESGGSGQGVLALARWLTTLR